MNRCPQRRNAGVAASVIRQGDFDSGPLVVAPVVMDAHSHVMKYSMMKYCNTSNYIIK
jgi:hypothetical protein